MSKEQIIDPRVRVKVYATGAANYHTKNEPMYVGKYLADKLIAAGKASATSVIDVVEKTSKKDEVKTDAPKEEVKMPADAPVK